MIKSCHPKKKSITTITSIDDNNKNNFKSMISRQQQGYRLNHLQHFNKFRPTIEQLIPDIKVNKEVLLQKWKDYSMIHSMWEPFNFIIYNGSHRIEDRSETHYMTRLKLVFPPFANMFVLFNGNLVHNGASSKSESSTYSMNWACDVRAFAYISTNSTERIRNSPIRTGFNDNNNEIRLRPRAHHDNNAGVATSYKGCISMPPYENNFDQIKCAICEKYKKSTQYKCNVNAKIGSTYGYEVHLDKIYYDWKILNKQKKPKKDQDNYLIPIVGNLEQDGWAVFEGVDICNEVDRFKNLREDISDMIHLCPNQWNNLQNGTGTNCGRMQRKMTEHHLIGSNGKKEGLKSTVEYYKVILQERLKKIYGFDNCEYTGMSLLYNKNQIKEQRPHKDYEPTHYND